MSVTREWENENAPIESVTRSEIFYFERRVSEPQVSNSKAKK